MVRSVGPSHFTLNSPSSAALELATSTRLPASHSLHARARSGAAAVEFAFVAPLLLLLVLGSIDLGRGIMVVDLLSHAARAGCRVGVLGGYGNSDINNAVSTALASANISGASSPAIDVLPQATQVWVSPGDAGTAQAGDAIRVTVSVKYQQVSWLAFTWFLSPSASLSSAVVMTKE